MPGTPKRLAGPLALTTTLTTNVFNVTSALIYSVITHIRIVNKHASTAAKATLYLGATGGNAAGTEVLFQKAVAVGDVYDWYGRLRMDSTDFLVGGSDTATALTIEIEGEQAVV